MQDYCGRLWCLPGYEPTVQGAALVAKTAPTLTLDARAASAAKAMLERSWAAALAVPVLSGMSLLGGVLGMMLHLGGIPEDARVGWQFLGMLWSVPGPILSCR